jgi:hypothetical protein
MAAIKLPINQFLGGLVKGFAKTQYDKVKEIIDKLNELSTTTNDVIAKSITAPTGTLYINTNGAVVEKHTAVAINATATATAAQLSTGLVTSTSAAATAITFPTAASMITSLNAAVGSSYDLIVDNVAGANTVTMTASASITFGTAVLTGGATATVAAGTVGVFRIYFNSLTAAKVFRVA